MSDCRMKTGSEKPLPEPKTPCVSQVRLEYACFMLGKAGRYTFVSPNRLLRLSARCQPVKLLDFTPWTLLFQELRQRISAPFGDLGSTSGPRQKLRVSRMFEDHHLLSNTGSTYTTSIPNHLSSCSGTKRFHIYRGLLQNQFQRVLLGSPQRGHRRHAPGS